MSDIICVMNELENIDRNADESAVGHINPYSEDDMLGIEPLELHFPFELNSQIPCSLELTNETNAFIAFSIQTTSLLPYCIQSNKGIVAPRSKLSVNIILQPLDKAPTDKCTDYFIVRSTKVNESLISEDLVEDIFNGDEGKLVDEVNLTITYKAESKINSSTSDEVIQFVPPVLYFPLVLDKQVLSSIKIINITESYVSFIQCFANKNTANYESIGSSVSILPPRTSQQLMITREEKEGGARRFNDRFRVGYAIVGDGTEDSDLDQEDYNDWKEVPIVLTKINSCTSNELIQFDPPELSFPCLNKILLSSVNIVNITDCHIYFDMLHSTKNVAHYESQPSRGILPPRSTQRVLVKRVPKEKEPEDMQCEDNLFVWNIIVAEGVEDWNICDFSLEESKELPLIFKKTSPCTSDELIRLDHPGLRFTFSPNKFLTISSVNMVNVTDYYVGFRLFNSDKDAAVTYYAETEFGIMAPRSVQRSAILRLVTRKEPEGTQYNKFFMWNAIVSEGVKVSDLDCYMSLTIEQSNELPIILNKVTSSTSVEMIKFDPPQVCFPFMPSKHLLSSIKIVNITDYHIGFNTHVDETNTALYITEPPCGVLPPWSTQELVVTRVAKEEASELEDMQCKDRYFVWSCFVTEDVSASDLKECTRITESKELPIVFTETSSSISDELIQFDPPELHFPFLPNKKVMTSVKIVNPTDYNVGFNTYSGPTNAVWFHTEPPRGILPPRSTQKLMVTREEKEDVFKDMQFNVKYFVWVSIVSDGVKDRDLGDYMADQESKELPIVLDKISSSTSDELVQLDPAELRIPLLFNKKMLFRVNVLNTTDFYVAFNVYTMTRNATRYKKSEEVGILGPRSCKRCILATKGDYFVWNRVVTEGVESGDIVGYMSEEESKKLPFILNKASPCTSNVLIQFDPPELSLPFIPNNPLVFSVDIVNITDYYVCFNIYEPERNVGWYYIEPEGGVMPPRSTQRLVVKRIPKENEHEDMQCEDKFFLWSSLVSEAVEATDIVDFVDCEGSKELPIVYQKPSLCTSGELIQFDLPELLFTSLPNNRVSMLRNFKIVNITDQSVGFKIWSPEENFALYKTEPETGILPPQSTQKIKVRRTLEENELEDMQCKDKFFVWNGIVTEGIKVSDVEEYWDDEDKELPIVLTASGGSS